MKYNFNYEKKRTNRYSNKHQLKRMAEDLSTQQYQELSELTEAYLVSKPKMSTHLQEKVESGYVKINDYLYQDILKGNYDLVEASVERQVQGNYDARVLLRSKKSSVNLILGAHTLERAEQNLCLVLSLSNGQIVTAWNDDVDAAHKKTAQYV